MLTQTQQLDIAEAAHQMAYEAFFEIEQGQEPDYTRADLERLAMAALLTHAPASPVVAGNLQAEAIWRYNFYAGWRHAELVGYGLDDLQIDLPARETGALMLFMPGNDTPAQREELR